ncbi:MAG: acetolactate synthase 3 large subunit [Gammaproteobacteria bacterium]|nr:acetolactate synthase 3 large subunit [Gammaproteobacteria bacterium]
MNKPKNQSSTEVLQLSGAEIVVRSLIDIGVKHVFGYPGGAVLDIYDALYQQQEFKHILVRHEQAAVHAADGYARSTGDVGTVLVTSGPGATNTITGIATAYMDSIPLVVISGQVTTSLIGCDAFQETDMVGCSRPVVKHSFLCTRAEDISCTIAKAYHIAKSGRPGPVVVDLPKDVMDPQIKHLYTSPKVNRLRSYNPTLKGNPRQIKKALTTMLKAKRPVFYTGGGVVIANASEQLTKLAEQLNVPVTSTLMGLGSFPGEHQQFVGMLGMHGTLEANNVMSNADVIVAFGARFDDRVTNNVDKFCPGATIIHIDIDPASISKNINADIPIVGSVDFVLNQFIELFESIDQQVDKEANELWWKQISQWRDKQCLSYEKDPKMIKPQQVIEAIYKATNGDAYVTSDVGQHQMFGALYYPFKKPRQWINSGGLGTMGFGLPAAVGVQLAHPDAVVVCISGDGSIQMNIQELATCLQYDLPIKIFTINNASLGMVRQWQDMIYGGRHSHSYMDSVPDFAKLAEAYGHVGLRVADPNELDATIEKAMNMKDKLVFVDIIIGQTEHVYPMQIKGGSMDEMWLSKGVRG